jgi:uncharacterized protein (TIGR03437 family)
MCRNLSIVLLTAGLLRAQVQLQFPVCTTGSPASCSSNVRQGATYSILLPIPNGDRLLIGTQPTFAFGASRQAIALSAIGPTTFQGGLPPGNLPVLGGNGNDVPAAAAVDPKGNIWIVGSTNSDDFNLVNPIVSQKVPYRTAGFVIELDPTGVNLLFATYLCGHQTGGRSAFFSSGAGSIVFDASGSAYIAGLTNEPDFPVTPGAFQTNGGGADAFGDVFYYSFVVKISPAGKLIYSTLLGSSAGSCSGGSSCIGKESTRTEVNGMAVDATGSVTLSGSTNPPGFPVTVSAPIQGGFVSRLSPDASKLVWSTFAGGTFGYVPYLGMALDSQGNVDLFGEYQPLPQIPFGPAGTPGLFAAQLSSDGSRLNYSSDLGQSPDASAHGITPDSAGNIYLTGTTSSAQFPTLPNVPNLGADFVLTLNASGKPQTLVRLPTGTISGPAVFDAGTENLLLVSGQTAVLQLPATPTAAPAIVGYSNAASLAVNRGLFPGTLISLYGFNLASTAQAAPPGKFPTTLGGVQVLVNTIAAPLLYVGPNQINLQVPFETNQNDVLAAVQIQVILPSGTLNMQFAPALSLGLFPVALNQDGTVNSPTNPAPQGSIVTLFGTGALWPPSLADGALASGATPFSQEMNLFQVVDSQGAEASILYAGTAPGLIDGVFQLNVQLPLGESTNYPAALTLSSGAGSALGAVPPSNKVQIYHQ